MRAVEPLDEHDAVALFVDCARLLTGELSVAAETRPNLEQICRQLDGLPLAIELAAGQLRVLEPAALAARLDDRFALLQSRRATSERQRTLLATVQWSYELLTPSAKDTFGRLGVFPGSFTLEAAEAVASDATGSGPSFLTLLSELVDHSLVVRDMTGPTPARYRLLDTLRLFARQRLEARAAWNHGQHAHAEFLIGLAETAAPHFYAANDVTWRKRLQAEDHNFRAVLDWAAEHEPSLAHRLAVALWFYWDVRWQERYATEFLQRLLDRHPPRVPEDLRAWALTAGADLAGKMGEGRISFAWAEKAVQIFERLGDIRGLGWARLALGLSLANRGALEQANDVLTDALHLAGELADERVQARALQWLGFVSVRRGDLDRATAYHRQALDVWTRGDSIRGRAAALQWLAGIERDRRHLGAADDLCPSSVGLHGAAGGRGRHHPRPPHPGGRRPAPGRRGPRHRPVFAGPGGGLRHR